MTALWGDGRMALRNVWKRLRGGAVNDTSDDRFRTSVPPNTPCIVNSLMRVHDHQLLVEGIFNADSHGSNFLLLPDGRTGLIDYGSTKELMENERLHACVLYATLARKDREKIWAMARLGGYESKRIDQEVHFLLAKFGFDSWRKEVTGGKNVHKFMDKLKARDSWYETP